MGPKTSSNTEQRVKVKAIFGPTTKSDSKSPYFLMSKPELVHLRVWLTWIYVLLVRSHSTEKRNVRRLEELWRGLPIVCASKCLRSPWPNPRLLCWRCV